MSAPEKYKGHLLSTVSTRNDDGTYQARAAITAVRDGYPESQRFVDFEVFCDQTRADQRAMSGARDWVDDQLRVADLAVIPEFALLASTATHHAPVTRSRRASDGSRERRDRVS